jgi:hypothetical protein
VAGYVLNGFLKPRGDDQLDRPWAAAPAPVLHGIDVGTASPGSQAPGTPDSGVFWLDDNAAGRGRYVHSTLLTDSEFATPDDQGEEHRMDLLMVLEHEVGHLLGYNHEQAGVMQETLSPGERLTPGRVAADAIWSLAGLPQGTQKHDPSPWWL